jgi:dienelactone hydrolase
MRHSFGTVLYTPASAGGRSGPRMPGKGWQYMGLKTRTIEYRDGGTLLTGQLVWKDPDASGGKEDRGRGAAGGCDELTDGHGDAVPLRGGRGILVVHGGAGLDDHARGRAARFAELGFVVFACDMYGDGVAGDRGRVMARIAELRSDRSILCRRVRAGIDVLAAQPGVSAGIVAVGYCFGGMTVLELARSGAELAGVVSVHGTLDTKQRAAADSIRSKVLVCHGALDPHVPMTQVAGFTEEMNQARADFQLVIYGGAQHGFTHEKGMNVSGVAYHAQADMRSSIAIQSFFSEVFGLSGDGQSAGLAGG